MTDELAESYSIDSLGLDLEEIQGTPEQIALNKVKLAATICNTPDLIKDVSLCFNAYNWLPGPYIKDFMNSVGNDGLWKMIQNFEDRSGYAQCIFAFCEGPQAEPMVFTGRLDGQIVEPRGVQRFGWDVIFQPEGFEQTLADMDLETKHQISHRGKAIALVKQFLQEQRVPLILRHS